MKFVGKLNGPVVNKLPTSGNVIGDEVNFNGFQYSYQATGWEPTMARVNNISYKKSFWSALTDFTAVGFTPTINNGAIRITGGANSYGQYLTINGTPSEDQNLDLEVTYRWVTAGSVAGTGIAIGRSSYNAFSTYKTSTAAMDYAGSKGVLVVATNAALSGSVGSATYTVFAAIGDVCRLKYSQRGNLVYAVYENLTQNTKFSSSYFTPFILGGTIQIPNASLATIYNIGGTIDILGIEVVSRSLFNPYVLAIGDSKTMGWGCVSPTLSFANAMNQLGPTTIWAGGADNTQEILTSLPNAYKLNPQYVLLCIGRNDIANGVTAATYQANYQSIVNGFTNAGAKVILLTPIPETTVSQTVLDTWIRTTYPGQFIDSSINWVNATHLGSDGTHPNPDGHRLLGNNIVNNGLIPNSGLMYRKVDPFDALVPGVGF